MHAEVRYEPEGNLPVFLYLKSGKIFTVNKVIAMATLRTIKTPTSADMICVERGFVSAIIMIKPEPKNGSR